MDARSLPTLETWFGGHGVIIVRALAVSLAVLVACLGGMICVRSVAGSLSRPLPAAGLLAAGCLLGVWSLGVRAACRRGLSESLAPALTRCLLAGPTLAAVLVALALSIPGTSTTGLAALWGSLAAMELLSRIPAGLYTRTGRPRNRRQAGLHDEARAVSPAGTEHNDVPGQAVEKEIAEEISHDISQRLVRRHADGEDTIEGLLRVDFAAGERTAHGHVAFCPPFAAGPACDAEQTDGPPARIRLGQLFAHGARFDVKLETTAAEATSVLLEFSARCPARSTSRAR